MPSRPISTANVYAGTETDRTAERGISRCTENQEKTAVNGSIKETEKLLHFIEALETQTEFSGEAFTEYVDNIIVYSRTSIGFCLKCGLTLKEELCTGTE